MIAGMAITASAMEDLAPVATEEALFTVHRQLLNAIARHGILIASPEDWERFTIAVECLDDTERTEWEVLIASLREHDRVLIDDALACLDDSDTLDAVEASLPHSEVVAVLASNAASALGIDASTGFIAVGKHELVRSRRGADAPRLTKLAGVAGRGFYAKGASREAFWSEVLRPLAEWSTEIVIADRYLYNELEWRSGRRRPASETVGWLLDNFSRHCPPNSKVTLIGGVGELKQPQTTARAADLVRSAWNPSRKRVGKVVVLGAHWKDGQLPHDRHLLFNCGMAVKLNAGLDRLRDPQLWDTDGTWWTHVWDPDAVGALQLSEDRMRAATDRGAVVPNPRLALTGTA